MSSLHAQFMAQKLNKYIDKLDISDGQDGYLQSETWNKLAEAVGCYHIPDGSTISVKRAKREVGEIFEGDTEEMRDKQEKFLDYANLASKSGYKISGEMLRISLTQGALTIGKHQKDGYTVLSPDDSNKKVEELMIPQGKSKAAKEETRLKAVLFDENSDVAKGCSSSSVVKNAVLKWVSEGAVSTTPIVLKSLYKSNWGLADDIDLGFGVGDCYLAGLHLDDSGYVKGYIEDVYDFSPAYHGEQNKYIQGLVSDACELQSASKLHKYRTLVPVSIYVGNNNSRLQNLQDKHETWSDKAAKCFTRNQKDRIPEPVKSVGKGFLNTTEKLCNKIKSWF